MKTTASLFSLSRNKQLYGFQLYNYTKNVNNVAHNTLYRDNMIMIKRRTGQWVKESSERVLRFFTELPDALSACCGSAELLRRDADLSLSPYKQQNTYKHAFTCINTHQKPQYHRCAFSPRVTPVGAVSLLMGLMMQAHDIIYYVYKVMPPRG